MADEPRDAAGVGVAGAAVAVGGTVDGLARAPPHPASKRQRTTSRTTRAPGAVEGERPVDRCFTGAQYDR